MGDGSPLRQFIYSRDLAKLFIWQLREYESVEPVIFSGTVHDRPRYSCLNPFEVDENDEISIKQVANSIATALGYPGQAVFENEPKDNGQDRKPASNAKLIKLIGPDFKFTPFDTGSSHLFCRMDMLVDMLF